MNTMVERVAKAIYEADDVWSEAFPWPQMGSKDQSADNYRRIARAAIAAMREPTEDMVDAACGSWVRLYPAFKGEKPQPTAGDVVGTCHAAMIDAALAE